MTGARLGVLTVVMMRPVELFGEQTRMVSVDEGGREEVLLR